MNAIATPVNRHPVDRLADLRAQMKALEAEEKEAAAEVSRLMGDAPSLGGDEFIATQGISERKGSIDAKKLAAAGIDVDAYRGAPSVSVRITLARRVQDEAA